MKNNSIPRQYVLNEKNKKVAVMLDIKTFDKIEEALENYGLMKFIKENKNDKPLRDRGRAGGLRRTSRIS